MEMYRPTHIHAPEKVHNNIQNAKTSEPKRSNRVRLIIKYLYFPIEDRYVYNIEKREHFFGV